MRELTLVWVVLSTPELETALLLTLDGLSDVEDRGIAVDVDSAELAGIGLGRITLRWAWAYKHTAVDY